MHRPFRTILIAAAFFLPTLPLTAGAPFANRDAPGFSRARVGKFEVTALTDGTFDFPAKDLLTNIPAAELEQALGRAFLSNPYQMSINAFLINTGVKLILVDAGLGTLPGELSSIRARFGAGHYGRLPENLRASGYRPEQVDEVLLTHLHPDHVGGLSRSGTRVFPNAVVRAERRDADYWLSAKEAANHPEDPRFEAARHALDPYVRTDRFRPFEGPAELESGIHALPAAGHTAGHTMFRIESEGRTLVLWGDLLHVPAVQFGRPATTIRYDSDSPRAAETRAAAFEEAAREGYLAGGAHIPFPGLGHVRREGAGYVWVPGNYELISAQ